jgi:hypothetical protein
MSISHYDDSLPLYDFCCWMDAENSL